MNRRVYGLIGISSVMSNWNADFTGRPKSTSKGDIYGSDKALKYPMKVKWESEGHKVLYIKSLKEDGKGNVSPRSLSERYEHVFGEKVSKDNTEVLKNLFSCTDVMNFGATFAEEKSNFSITGAVQIGQGFNLYEDSRVEVQDILSPFRNSKNDEAGNSSLGTKITSDEAHYCYPFTVNPNNYKNYAEILEGFNGYTEEAYVHFKSAARLSATAFSTNSKFGCDNEYALFIELKEAAQTVLPILSSYVTFHKTEKSNQLEITALMTLLSEIDAVDNIELYYNPSMIQIIDESGFSGYTKKHIITGKDV